jgi:hypothetical protein
MIQYLILKGQCEIIIFIQLGLVLLNEQEELVTQRSHLPYLCTG